MIQLYDIKITDNVEDTFKDMFGEAIQEIRKIELDTHLGYGKNSKETKNTISRLFSLIFIVSYVKTGSGGNYDENRLHTKQIHWIAILDFQKDSLNL